jgi:hypothetical protein
MKLQTKLKGIFQRGLLSLCLLQSTAMTTFVSQSAYAETSVPYGKAIVAVDLDQLNAAKDLAATNGENKALFAIMDIIREWQRLSSHNQKQVAVEKMITAALKQAADGHFTTANFMIKDVTNSIITDDEAMFSDGLKEDLKQKLYELESFLARESVRTGLQAGSEYYIEVTRSTENTKGTNYVRRKNGRTKNAKRKEKKHIVKDTKQLTVFAPEMSTGAPVYDKEAQTRFNSPFAALNSEDFQKEVIGMLEPYSDIKTKTKISYHSKKWGLFDRLFKTHYWRSPYARRNTFRWSEYYKINKRFIADGDLLVQFRKFTTRPMFEEDRIAWSGALKQKFSDVKTVLDIMFAKSENGYKLRIHSKSYDYFNGAYKQMVQGLKRVQELGNSTGVYFLNNDEVSRLSVAYPEMLGDRPDNLESSFEVALSYATGEVKNLISSSYKMGQSSKLTYSFTGSEYKALLSGNGDDVVKSFGSRGSQDLRETLVGLYMTGKEDVVKKLFLKLSNHIQNKVNLVNIKLDESKGNVFRALSDPTNSVISFQLDKIDQARQIIAQGQQYSFEPSILVSSEELTSALEKSTKKRTYKKIYRDEDVVQFVQVNMRKSLGDAKAKITEVKEYFQQNPTVEVRQALIEFLNFYNSKVNELDEEFWPFIKYSGVIDPTTDCITKIHPNGKPEMVCEPKYTIEEMAFFKPGQKSVYNMATVATIKQIEEHYASRYFEEVYLSLEKFAVEIGDVYREFSEYPSHNISIALKVALEDFQKLRRSVVTKTRTYKVADKISDRTGVDSIIAKYKTAIDSINWVNEAGTVGSSVSDLLNKVESLREKYDDLLIPTI